MQWIREKCVVDPSGPRWWIRRAIRRVTSELDLGGTFYETFVAAELARQISWLEDRPQTFHFRDRDQREVDILLEHRDG